MAILEDLAARGVLANVTDRDGLAALLGEPPVTLYAGYDPTSAGLHVGNLVPTMLLARFQAAGHRPIVLVGGATGMIGDPSGKSDERNLLDEATLATNLAGIAAELSRFLDFSPTATNAAVMANNHDWFKATGYLEFLRRVGKHLTVNYMMAKDSVRSRLEDRDRGISYTEFSYMLLQAWDFVQLAERHGCRLQVGGNDQYGNITAGCELSRKLGGPQLYGLTAPLLLDSTGQKMGKTSTGERVWLDPARTSPYAFYQYWLNTADDKAPEHLRMFSFRPLAELEAIERAHATDPSARVAQRALADDLTRWVHGADGLRRAEAATAVMFGGSLDAVTDADLEPLIAEVGCIELPEASLAAGVALVDLLVQAGLTGSKGEARRLIGQGGVYVNNVRITEATPTIGAGHRGTRSFLFLRSGKKKYRLVRVVGA